MFRVIVCRQGGPWTRDTLCGCYFSSKEGSKKFAVMSVTTRPPLIYIQYGKVLKTRSITKKNREITSLEISLVKTLI